MLCHKISNSTNMESEKLCLQWNDFQTNLNVAFKNLREDKDFNDVTLACDDGSLVEAHKVVLAASSPVFQNLLRKNKHNHPLIYMRGVKAHDLLAIVDFLYFGEANVSQENLDSFLALAEELKLEGLTGQKSSDLVCEDLQPVDEVKETCTKSNPFPENHSASNVEFEKVVIPKRLIIDNLGVLDETVKSMMEKSKNMVPAGKHPNGRPRQTAASICRVCGKEGHPTEIKRHIEGKHLEGISIPCTFCVKVFSSRNAFGRHKCQ